MFGPGDKTDRKRCCFSELENRSWDVVIDNSGQKSEWTKKTATMLREKAETYLYISSRGDNINA